jgi:hypothetical protein
MELIISKGDFTIAETDNVITYKATKPNNKGFKINISFTKNQDEHEESMEAIEQFFIREVL